MKNAFQAPLVAELLQAFKQIKTYDRQHSIPYDMMLAFQSNLLDFNSTSVQEAFEKASAAYNLDDRQKDIQKRHLKEVSSLHTRNGFFSILDTTDKEGNALACFNLVLDNAIERGTQDNIQKQIVYPVLYPKTFSDEQKAAKTHTSNYEMSTYDALIMSAADYHMGGLLIEANIIQPLKKTGKQKAALHQTARVREQTLCGYAETVYKLCTAIGQETGMDLQQAQKPNVLAISLG